MNETQKKLLERLKASERDIRVYEIIQTLSQERRYMPIPEIAKLAGVCYPAALKSIRWLQNSGFIRYVREIPKGHRYEVATLEENPCGLLKRVTDVLDQTTGHQRDFFYKGKLIASSRSGRIVIYDCVLKNQDAVDFRSWLIQTIGEWNQSGSTG